MVLPVVFRQMSIALAKLTLIFLFLSACQPTQGLPSPETSTVIASLTPAPLATFIPSLQPSSSPSPETAITQTPLPAPTPTFSTCPPLYGFTPQEIPTSVSNPYHPPAIGKDDPHAGVDLADRSPDTQIALKGREVQAALAGQVGGVIKNRFPFGNAVIIETHLENLPANVVTQLNLPGPMPPFKGPVALTCPSMNNQLAWDQPQRSIYLLYAHMEAAPQFNLGDEVACGQALGTVGDTGNALNPHLHLEARAGPSGWSFASLAHYDNSATPEEMSAYCTWAVSGLFQVFNPLGLFQ